MLTDTSMMVDEFENKIKRVTNLKQSAVQERKDAHILTVTFSLSLIGSCIDSRSKSDTVCIIDFSSKT